MARAICCEIAAQGRVCNHLGSRLLAMIARYRDAGRPVQEAISTVLRELDRAGGAAAAPDKEGGR